MTVPGPDQLGRGVVVRAGAAVPEPWAAAPIVTLDAPTLADEEARPRLIDRLHRHWVGREPLVVVWDGPDDMLQARETSAEPPWRHAAGFLFPLERLRFLCFTNNYDARNGEPRWWWAVKAGRIDAAVGGPADALLPDGTAVWIDGGPRRPFPNLGHPLIHGESVDAGIVAYVPGLSPLGDDGLAPDQREAVAHPAGAARIIAPAGSGKTRTLAARLRRVLDDYRIEPSLVTAVAYNERAAAELRERLGVGKATARTIHSLGWEILREARPGLELLDERGVRDVIDRLISIPRRANTDPVAPYLEALSAVRSRLRDPAEVELSRDDVAGFGDAFERARERMYAIGRVDHGEQVYGAIEALLAHPDLRARWQRRCRHLLVDEFQDLTPAFVLLLRLVASPELSVFGVGDDDQVIYGYDGADPGFLIDFDHYFPGAGAHALVTNYRCPPAVVDAAGNLLSYNRRRIDKSIEAARSDRDEEALVVARLPGAELAGAVADRIAGWIAGGTAPGSVAVLTRVNASLVPVKAALVERGIPSHDLLGPGTLDRTAVRALFAWMRLALRPERMQRGDLLTAVRRPGRGLSRAAQAILTRRTLPIDDLLELGERLDDKQQRRWEGFCDDLVAAASIAAKGDAARLVDALVDDVGLGSSARALDSGRGNASRSGHLDDLVAVARAAPLHLEAEGFEEWLRRTVAVASDPLGVTLSSVHRVKGMEWPCVVVFGADRGTMPHDLSEDMEEERRVFHVALTRASDRVVVLADERRPSPFLAELAGAAPEAAAKPAARAARTGKTSGAPFVGDRVRVWGGTRGEVIAIDGADLTVRLDEGGELEVHRRDIVEVTPAPPPPLVAESAALVEALKTWRRETAGRLGVPAYVVLHDSTIEDIARRRPRTERDLLGISGIGPSKLEQYGDDLLGVVGEAADL
jgi:DNA helicase II / ATP-dependent DNA helicase PcrA